MELEIDIYKPITVTSSKRSQRWIELKMVLINGEDINIPMHLITAKKIGLTLTTVSERLSADNQGPSPKSLDQGDHPDDR